MSPSLSLKSAANTLRLIYLRGRAVSTPTLTISRPLWMRLKFTTTEMGQLTSPLFSQEREVSANPFCVSCSQTHSSVEKSRQDVDPFSSVEKSRLGVEPFSTFEKRLSKGKRNRELESEQDSQMEKERILSEQRYSWLPWKDNWSCFHGDFAAQSRLSEAQSDLDRRDWKMRHADVALCETGIQLQPGGRNLYQAHQLSDQTQRKKRVGYVKN